MSKFRKKPVEIEAIQFNGYNVKEIEKFIGKELKTLTPGKDITLELYIETLEGTMTAIPGDYIIRGVKGEYYPCKPDIFRETYDEVEEEEEIREERYLVCSPCIYIDEIHLPEVAVSEKDIDTEFVEEFSEKIFKEISEDKEYLKNIAIEMIKTNRAEIFFETGESWIEKSGLGEDIKILTSEDLHDVEEDKES